VGSDQSEHEDLELAFEQLVEWQSSLMLLLREILNELREVKAGNGPRLQARVEDAPTHPLMRRGPTNEHIHRLLARRRGRRREH
jgi:hypothetical protein